MLCRGHGTSQSSEYDEISGGSMFCSVCFPVTVKFNTRFFSVWWDAFERISLGKWEIFFFQINIWNEKLWRRKKKSSLRAFTLSASVMESLKQSIIQTSPDTRRHTSLEWFLLTGIASRRRVVKLVWDISGGEGHGFTWGVGRLLRYARCERSSRHGTPPPPAPPGGEIFT